MSIQENSLLAIKNGWAPEQQYISLANLVADDVNSSQFHKVREKINNTFFGGGCVAPKSWSHILSTTIPYIDGFQRHNSIEVKRKIAHVKSFGAMLGYIEGIPVIGSAIAIISALGHLIAMNNARDTLQNKVEAITDTSNTSQRAIESGDVIQAAIDYTVHYNQLIASLLSIIPLVKPITRLVQGILFSCRNPVQHDISSVQRADSTDEELSSQVKEIFNNIPERVKQLLSGLFKGSPYSLDSLTVFPDKKWPERELMTSSIVIGITSENLPWIAIRLFCNLTDENMAEIAKNDIHNLYIDDYQSNRKVDGILFLGQSFPNGPRAYGGTGENSWYAPLRQSIEHVIPTFFDSNITCQLSGRPTESQEGNLKNVHALIKEGSSTDLHGIRWQISE